MRVLYFMGKNSLYNIQGSTWLRLMSKTCVHHSKQLYHEENETNYQYLQESSIPTLHFQASLPRLPIPKLQDTCDRYLKSQQVILTPEEYAKTKKYTDDFVTGIGNQLQESLINKNDKRPHTSYISEPWSDMYLRDRVSLVHNYNPFFAFQPDVDLFQNFPIKRATNMIISSLRFMHSLRDEILKPEIYNLGAPPNETLHHRISHLFTSYATQCSYLLKAVPLDMSQYKNLFNSTRIPMLHKDRNEVFADAKHMLIMKNGNFYVFDVLDHDGNILPAEHILSCVEYIYNDNTPQPETPIGILTAHNRDKWAELRGILWNTGDNSQHLRLIDSAAFNFVLEPDSVGMDPKKCFKTFLSGDGTNRWFDKSFSIILSAEGIAALNFEHSWGDGVAVIRYFNEVANDISTNDFTRNINTFDASHHVRRLEFEIPPEVKAAVEAFIPEYEKARNSVDVDVFQSFSIGKRLCKASKVSPDAVMQLGFQIAFNLFRGESVSTYESCSTSMFKHGRTETLRPATNETKSLCSELLKPKDKWPSKSELKNMIIKCSKVHFQLTKEAATGKGFDRHLFGLRKICEEIGEPLPDFYKDESFNKLNYHIISTSTLPSAAISIGGFAPVVKNGLGIGYRILNDELGLVASSYPPHMDCKGFISCAEQAYDLIGQALSCK